MSFGPTLLRSDFFSIRPLFFSMVVTLQKTIDFASDITGVPFGRTEALVVPNDAPSRELSHGQVLGGGPFDGRFKSWVFHVFLGVLF